MILRITLESNFELMLNNNIMIFRTINGHFSQHYVLLNILLQLLSNFLQVQCSS